MNILIGSVLLWMAALVLARQLRARGLFDQAMESALDTLRFTLPRMVVALLGAEFLAVLMAKSDVAAAFGAGSGLRGILLAALAGPVTPGGAFVAFAIGAAALKTGAAAAPVVTYVTSWASFSLFRMMVYEMPLLGAHPVRMRVLVSWPIPLIVGLAALIVYGS